MNNDKKMVYAIRNLGFWYDDEYYSPLIPSKHHTGHICALFEHKEAAMQEWKRLEYDFSHKLNFQNIIGYEQASYDLEKIGLEIDNNIYDHLKLMNQDELFELIEKFENYVFFMYEYPRDLKIKTLWNTAENKYDISDATTDYDFIPNIFLTSFISTNDFLTDQSSPTVDAAIQINGTLDELSDTPLLLSQLIKNDPNIEYSEAYPLLKIKPDEKSLNSVNALLKKPLYEIRYLTINEIYAIEQALNQTTTSQ